MRAFIRGAAALAMAAAITLPSWVAKAEETIKGLRGNFCSLVR